MSLVDWSKIKKRFNWAAQDSNGTIYVYVEEPKIVEWHGSWAGKTYENTLLYAKGTKDAPNWRDSLEKRL